MSPVTSYRELMTEQARAAVRVSGAHHSSWNGMVRPLPPDPERHRGLADWDGTLLFSDARVTYHLQEMFHHRGRRHSQGTLRRYRDALKVVCHENIHLLTAAGAMRESGREAFKLPEGRVLEEGVTEAYTQACLNDYIEELGLEQVAPGISSVQEPLGYPHYVPAARTFAEAIGRRSGLDGTEVLRRMAVVGTEAKFRVAAELVYASSDLPGRVPESERPAAVQRIEKAMRTPLAHIHDLDPEKPADLKKAAAAGVEADRAGYQEVRALQRQWSNSAPGTSLSPDRATLDQDRPGLGSGRSEADGSDRKQPGEQPAAPAQGQAARIGLGGTAPIGRTQRLSSDQFGSRRQTVQSAQPHQPQRGD